MAERKPVVLVSGQLKELPAGDTLPPQAPAAHTHPATSITNTPAGGIAATNIQAAINELDSEKFNKTGGAISGGISVAGDVLATSGALGYGVGAGGAVTQAASKFTAVTLNKPSGQITMHNESLAAGAAARFTLINTCIGASDEVSIWLSDPIGNALSHIVWVDGVVDGVCAICVKNIKTTSLPLPLKIGFAVRKGATS